MNVALGFSAQGPFQETRREQRCSRLQSRKLRAKPQAFFVTQLTKTSASAGKNAAIADKQ